MLPSPFEACHGWRARAVAESKALWDVEWVDTNGTVIGAWRWLDREIAEHVAQCWLAAKPHSQVALARRVRVQGKERLELVQLLRQE